MKRLLLTILTLTCIISSHPQTVNATQSYLEYFEEIGDRYGICPELLQSIAWCESGFNPSARSGCNAQGLCQIIPKWQTERMARLGVTDLYDPYSNILVCADIIDEFREKYDDLYLVLMCYNEGEYSGCIDRWEAGNYSKYAIKVVENSERFEREHGK